MEGVKLIVNKALSSHFQVTHTVHMSALGPSNYHFNATFVGDRQLGPTEVFPTLVGDMDNSGSLNAQVLHLLAERIRTKAVFQVQVGVELEANTRLQDTTFAFGYQLNLPQANVVFRGLLDSNWSVGAVLEKKLPPLPVTLALGAFLNHWKNRFHCGFSVIVG
ncbi:UNVERIFIED_CONTAM: hypothetical protein H355_015638 [Colinus virginianus]|nr:hypothetical protein H355_015638 [Colinus virginianus]